MPKKCDEDGCTILLAPGIPFCGIHGRYKKPHKQSKMEEHLNKELRELLESKEGQIKLPKVTKEDYIK